MALKQIKIINCKFFVSFAIAVISAVILQDVAGENRRSIVSCDAYGCDRVGGLDVSIAMIYSYNLGAVSVQN